jgi:hypothetical protein
MEVKMASNKIKALALTSGIAMAAVIGSTTMAEARYCRAHYGWHKHCYRSACRSGYWGYARPTYWGYSRPARYVGCYRPRCGWYGSNWYGVNYPGYYGYSNPGYWGYGGGLLGAGTGLLGAGLFGWW